MALELRLAAMPSAAPPREDEADDDLPDNGAVAAANGLCLRFPGKGGKRWDVEIEVEEGSGLRPEEELVLEFLEEHEAEASAE